ncbi:MAG: formate C-acetyltransferase/glycerol dehydratase family glycyl radical enzyme [Bacteroidetes bacterium]|jgi:choline trimethylamine-lyase|nr:formate C-acetyltransferase/glycerol dehydratase family glycyl radical enzyme [Bacteroidota bacterium]MBT3750212.1 formate C-acetyltransferase/glycerol dehydratase family glycyl radical enzyme [Bacteroidota bacterium]MBT4398800.1 formate C-acetyltransferase/glycerol dehydratase family glycyl radical enzyme [Bacteroidota bacterium]MBT4412002.1 formate C-acetyltransferase/glycerol dehydratase family glycyl radical enzyme [Bacteroidota bacterium]MBT7093073.1 formate C-acetyltransferase/glycerol
MLKPEYADRIYFLKDRVLCTPPEMDLENAEILTNGFREFEGEPLVMRKAKAFRKQCLEKTVRIWDKELIVGCSGSKLRAGILCADTCWSVLNEELDTISERSYDPFHLKDEDRSLFEQKVRPYWKGRSSYEEWMAQIPDDTRDLRDAGVVYIDRKAVRGFGETTAGYEWLIREGIIGIEEVIRKRRARLDITVPGDYQKDYYLESLLIVGDGMKKLSIRYSREAEHLASLAMDGERKRELLEIAEVCLRVPTHPAQSFREALQALYFYQTFIFMEQNAASYNPGRMDQYLLPYYNADLKSGAITKDQAQELIECLWVKFAEPCLFQDAVTAEFAAGYPMFQNVCVGGVDETGRDAVNELSYMILQATMDVQLYQPSLSVRYSLAKNPSNFLRKVVELIALGTGFPAFHNDDIGIRMLMNKGIPLREAFDWNPCGCVETNLEGRLRHYTALADVNLGSVIELALLDGRSRKANKYVSVRTGNAEEFETFELFLDAIKKQFAYVTRAVVKGSHIIDEVCMNRPSPALSLTFKDCIESAKDYAWGGAKYNTGNGIILIGVADLINSISAIKHIVFDTQLVSMSQLLKALEDDFDGHDDILKLCRKAPKYGNDNPDVDWIAGDIFTYFADEIESYNSKFGKMTPGILPVSGNTPFGLEVGALPSGKRAWKPLADGVSPMGGTDMNGSGSVLKSVANIPHDRFVQGTLLNLKVEPAMLHDENGVRQMMAFLKSMCSLGVYHVQFNVIDQEKLLKAQESPDDYRGLLVRVAGYSAYFVELGKDVQDDIIGRTMLHGISVG